jgi:hypothetical protein
MTSDATDATIGQQTLTRPDVQESLALVAMRLVIPALQNANASLVEADDAHDALTVYSTCGDALSASNSRSNSASTLVSSDSRRRRTRSAIPAR